MWKVAVEERPTGSAPTHGSRLSAFRLLLTALSKISQILFTYWIQMSIFSAWVKYTARYFFSSNLMHELAVWVSHVHTGSGFKAERKDWTSEPCAHPISNGSSIMEHWTLSWAPDHRRAAFCLQIISNPFEWWKYRRIVIRNLTEWNG